MKKTLWYHYLDTVQACKTQKRILCILKIINKTGTMTQKSFEAI